MWRQIESNQEDTPKRRWHKSSGDWIRFRSFNFESLLRLNDDRNEGSRKVSKRRAIEWCSLIMIMLMMTKKNEKMMVVVPCWQKVESVVDRVQTNVVEKAKNKRCAQVGWQYCCLWWWWWWSSYQTDEKWTQQRWSVRRSGWWRRAKTSKANEKAKKRWTAIDLLSKEVQHEQRMLLQRRTFHCLSVVAATKWRIQCSWKHTIHSSQRSIEISV